jgi:serine/threonine protein phosphatase PrpC
MTFDVQLKGGDDTFIVMASDGVWEFIDSPEGVNLVAQFIEASATEACTRLIETSAAKWRQEEGDYRDDITAICVRLGDIAKDMAEA